MPPNPFQKLFVSYRSTDSKQVDMIIARLRTLKASDGNPRFHVWQDKDGIPEGQDWWEAIVEALIACNVLIFMISRESVKNINCRAELNYARKRNRPVIPVVLEGEYDYNPKTGKNDIDFWGDIPDELNDLRAQFLFYEGASFVERLERALEQFAREPQRWRDLPVSFFPRDPRQTSDETNNVIALYDEACDYAWRVEFPTAERLFTRLINMNDPIFSDDAHQWILLLREYQTVIALDSLQSTRHKAKPQWESYVKRFPVAFISGIFDPKDMRSRYSAAVQVVTPPAPPKPRSRVLELLPRPFEWIDIPAGKVTLVNDWDDDAKVYLKKNQPQTFDVPAFAIAKYPITNAQYAKFIQAGGYTQKRWWTDAGWDAKAKGMDWDSKKSQWVETNKAWTQPRYWTDAKWNGSEYPVVGVSWYEVIAFCKWVSEVSGESILLPTEQQWQRAAQGDQGLTYPWGNKFAAARCNTSESKISKTTPVTRYAGNGDSPFGVTDLVGNVWEWCLTNYYFGDIELEGVSERCLRGGSWSSDLGYARAACRNCNSPSNRNHSWGFRVVIGSVPI